MPRLELDYGNAVIPTGFFLARTGEAPRPITEYADLGTEVGQHLSTFPERSTIKTAVLNSLRNAQRHVLFANFLVQDEDVVAALIDAAQRLRGHVYILTTLKADDFSSTLQGDQGGEADFQAHIRCVELLSRSGLLIKARSDCHAKFMTVDDDIAIVTSANAVPTCYGNVPDRRGQMRDANPENGIQLSLRSEVHRLANFFRSMWKSGCNYYVAPGSDVFRVDDIQSGHPNIPVIEPVAPTQEGETLWTAPNDLRILNRLVRMLDDAEREVSLASWVVKGMDGHVLGTALKKAVDRGVSVRMLVRGMNTRDDLRDQCYRLKKATEGRIQIVGDFWNHAKAIVCDDREAMLMTANLDAQHGLDSGVEVGFWSAAPSFVTAVSRFLNRLYEDAAFVFDTDLSQADVAKRLGRQKEPRLTGKLLLRIESRSVFKNDDQVRRWGQELGKQLVRVARHRQEGRDMILLLTNSTAAYCTQSNGVLRVQRVENNPSREILSKFSSYLGASNITIEWN